MTARVEFTDKGLDKIIAGFEELSRGPSRAMQTEWELASERFFVTSQAHVHVLTGALKATGTYILDGDANEMSVELVYGGPVPAGMWTEGMKRVVDYAIYEHGRGGEHAWLTTAFAAVQRDFPEGLERGFVRTWS